MKVPLKALSLVAVSSIQALGGCGDSDRETSNKSQLASEAQQVSQKMPFRETDDIPPKGVKELVAFYQAGGPPNCKSEDVTSELTLSYGIDQLPRDEDLETLEPRLGDVLLVCALGVDGREKVTLEVEAPNSELSPLVERGYTDDRFLVNFYLYLMPRRGAGTWTFTARAGERQATMELDVGTTAAPAYRHVGTTESGVEFLLTGLGPRQAFALHIYKQPRNSAEPAPLLADYVSTVRGKANASGSQLFVFDPQGAEDACYVVKAEVGGRILDDRQDQLSTICPVFELESPPSERAR